MMHIHESWREEGGWLLVVVGLVVLAWGWLNIETGAELPSSGTVSLGMVIVGLIMACVGAAMHATRHGLPHAPPRHREHPTPLEPMDFDA